MLGGSCASDRRPDPNGRSLLRSDATRAGIGVLAFERGDFLLNEAQAVASRAHGLKGTSPAPILMPC